MRILFATSEYFPLLKTGGLADVSASLTQALASRGHQVTVILPGYRAVLAQLHEIQRECVITGFGLWHPVRLLETMRDNIRLWIVDCPVLFDRKGGAYQDTFKHDWEDNAQRFAQFSRVIYELASGRAGWGDGFDIIHCNDWQTGLVPAFMSLEKKPIPTLFTIHNLAYQGNFTRHEFEGLWLPEKWWSSDAMEFYGKVSFLKAGIVFSDQLTTVSPSYAKEILTPEFGCGLEGVLSYYQPKLQGILNGADYSLWDPRQDPYLIQRYGIDSLIRKQDNKLFLQRTLGLPCNDKCMVIGLVSRLVHQKGIDAVMPLIEALRNKPIQWVILGTGDHWFELELAKLAKRLPRILSVTTGYDEGLAHRIEAGADVFVMASRYEPCGLNQLYSLRYGTLPIVRRTGGLADTVVDVDEAAKAGELGTGFVFSDVTTDSLRATIARAMTHFDNKAEWAQFQIHAMRQDFSWEKSATTYETAYQSAINARKRIKSRYPTPPPQNSNKMPHNNASNEQPLFDKTAIVKKGSDKKGIDKPSNDRANSKSASSESTVHVKAISEKTSPKKSNKKTSRSIP